MTAPAPRSQPVVGHLGRWGIEPLALLEEGARLGPVFRLRLWRPAIVGYSPSWNRFVLGDLTTFRSRGSMSGLSPYLGAGVVQLDAPAHAERRRDLNPAFSRRALGALTDQLCDIVTRALPQGRFDAVAWSAALLQEILGETLLDGQVPPRLLAAFLRPLDRALPAPFLPRPILFRRMNTVLRRALDTAPADSLTGHFQGLTDGVDELRVALSAGYDTTAHTLAWLLAHAAQDPTMLDPARRSMVIDEVLRLYPAGWLGSRRCARDVEFDGIVIKRGTLVLYSPFLTHRDPQLWKNPLQFDPERFRGPIPAWGFIPFAAGERSCLGRAFARLVLHVVLEVLTDRQLQFLGGDLRPRAAITLTPTGPLHLYLAPAKGPA